jgi:hypothetical protein
MKKISSLLLLLLIAPINLSFAGEVYPVILQLKYAPWGLIDADDEQDGFWLDENFEKYDMHFERSVGARLIFSPYYVAASRSVTDLDANVPDTVVETLSGGVGGAGSLGESNYYLLGAVGVGRGRFTFKDPDMNDWENFVEANAEIGIKIDFLMLGTGVDWQLFGSPGETKAIYWNLYVGTGISF